MQTGLLGHTQGSCQQTQGDPSLGELASKGRILFLGAGLLHSGSLAAHSLTSSHSRAPCRQRCYELGRTGPESPCSFKLEKCQRTQWCQKPRRLRFVTPAATIEDSVFCEHQASSREQLILGLIIVLSHMSCGGASVTSCGTLDIFLRSPKALQNAGRMAS